MSSGENKMDQTQMVALAEGQLQAYNARDLDKFCACYHAEVVTQSLITGQTGVSGMTAFREMYKTMFAESPNLKCELRNRTVLGAAVIDEEWVTGRRTQSRALTRLRGLRVPRRLDRPSLVRALDFLANGLILRQQRAN